MGIVKTNSLPDRMTQPSTSLSYITDTSPDEDTTKKEDNHSVKNVGCAPPSNSYWYSAQIVTNLIYLWPAYEAGKRQWYGIMMIYLLTGVISALHHWHDGQSTLWHHLDYGMATLFFLVSFGIWWNEIYLSSPLVIASCVLSFVLFAMERTEKECGLLHIAWHLMTGLGVGYMVSLVPIVSPEIANTA